MNLRRTGVRGAGRPARFNGKLRDRFDARPAPMPRANRGGLLEALETRRLFATIIVTGTSDSIDANDDQVSLREAIIATNTNVGSDVIQFNIQPGGVQTIKLLSDLPLITEAVTIDGTTQLGYAGTPLVEVDGNGFQGLRLNSTNANTVKGLALYGNSTDGIQLLSGKNIIKSNYIGLRANGTGLRDDLTSTANGRDGIRVTSSNNQIGGTVASDRNVISNNTANGVNLFSPSATVNTVTGNYIGTDPTGLLDRGNGLDGVRIENAANNVIGGTTAAASNVIMFNHANGVDVIGLTATQNAIRLNSINANDALGIDLGNDGSTVNDSLDPDAGPNNLQNYPILTSISQVPGGTFVTGILNSTATTNFVVDFYASPTADGEGKTYLGSQNVQTGANGVANIATTLSSTQLVGQYVTATATTLDTSPVGDTSEFSQPIQLTTPMVSISDVVVTEGNSGTTLATFSVNIDQPVGQQVLLDFATQSGSATAGSDFVANSGTITFAPLQTSQTISVVVNGDTAIEPDETFSVVLSNPRGGVAIADGTGVGTITNDDAPALSIDDVTATEGDAGTKNFNFTVSLASAATQTVTVDFATANVSATAGSDYVSKKGTLTFLPGTTSQTISVVVNGDKALEPDETFNVILSNPTGTGTTITDGTGVGTITNDDTPTLTINDVTLPEGNSGTKNFPFTVSLGAVLTQTVTVDYTTVDVNATAGEDYVAKSGTLTFAPGVTSQPINVLVNGDTGQEPTETFNVVLSNVVGGGATITDATGVGTITNDDFVTAGFSVDSVSHNEGNSGITSYVFTVTRVATPTSTGPGTLDTAGSVRFAVQSNTAIGGSDYTAAGPFTLNFAKFQQTFKVAVAVKGDTSVESTENFKVVLDQPNGSPLGNSVGTGTIVNDDGGGSSSSSSPVLMSMANPTSTSEGNSGTKSLTFTVKLNKKTSNTVTVNYATANGTAVSTSDYTAKSGTLTFAPNETSKTITVLIRGDTTHESNETFLVKLSGVKNSVLSNTQATGTILNDD